jgi:hypothetical protein
MQVSKVTTVKAIVKLYFVGALAGSFIHTITAAHKAGLDGWEAWSVPFMVDGLALIGLVMRSASFSQATRARGIRVQAIMGMVSMAANAYAAHNVGGAVFGVALVGLWLASEYLAANLESAQADLDRQATEAMARAEADLAAKRQEAARRGAATRKANAARKDRRRKVEAKVLDDMLNR